MSMTTHVKSTTKRAAYHHGNLRDDLIRAARVLIQNTGQENFKVADACRHAGVSTAAPYRHFADRDAMLAAVAVTGFNDLRDLARAAGEQHACGSVEAVSAIGKAYVSFAYTEPNLFRLMFGRSGLGAAKNQTTENEEYEKAGLQCYEVLLVQLAVRLGREPSDKLVSDAAFPLFTFVHGLSFMVIDCHCSLLGATADAERQIDSAVERLMPAAEG